MSVRERCGHEDTGVEAAPATEVEQVEAKAKSSEKGKATATVDSGELLGSAGLLRIEHRGELYTLRITRNDRLILTK